MHKHEAYYSDDVTLLPASAIWRSSVRASILLAPGIFSYFYFRKLFGLPFRANYASPWPRELPMAGIETLPAEARDAFALRFPDLNANGFEFAFCCVSPFIGTKWGASAAFLSRDGQCYATLVWIKIRLGAFERSETIFACHSLLSTGKVLTTAPTRPAVWIPQLIPPDVTIVDLPPSTTLEETIRFHRERLREAPCRPTVLDASSLEGHMLVGAQQLYDHLISKGYYRKLSDAEVKRLTSGAN
jgi:hypothetical protein